MILSEKISMQKNQKMREQKGRCAHCGKKFQFGEPVELAHIVPQRKWTIKKYGKAAIHHPMNMKLTHSGRCNSGVQINPDSLIADQHMEAIINLIKEVD